MKRWTMLLVPVLVMGLVGLAQAKGAGKKDHGGAVKGKIVSIAADGSSITISHGHKAKAVEVKVPVNGSTKVEIDGVSKSLNDLHTGSKVVVTRSGVDAPATDIRVDTQHKGKHAGKKKAK